MLNYQAQITETVRLSPLTVAFHFKDFTIVDNLSVADYSYFYPDENLHTLLLRDVKSDTLGDPDFPYRTIVAAEDAQRINGVIQLAFVGPKREQTERFLNLKCQLGAQAFNKQLNGWFGAANEPASMRERLAAKSED